MTDDIEWLYCIICDQPIADCSDISYIDVYKENNQPIELIGHTDCLADNSDVLVEKIYMLINQSSNDEDIDD